MGMLVAICGVVTAAEAEIVVDAGEVDSDAVHTPGIFVQRFVHNPSPEKRIEQLAVRCTQPPADWEEGSTIVGANTRKSSAFRRIVTSDAVSAAL